MYFVWYTIIKIKHKRTIYFKRCIFSLAFQQRQFFNDFMGNLGGFVDKFFINFKGIFFTPNLIPPIIFSFRFPKVLRVNFFQYIVCSSVEEKIWLLRVNPSHLRTVLRLIKFIGTHFHSWLSFLLSSSLLNFSSLIFPYFLLITDFLPSFPFLFLSLFLFQNKQSFLPSSPLLLLLLFNPFLFLKSTHFLFFL